MRKPDDLLEEVTERLDRLQLRETISCHDDLSPISEPESDSKRPKHIEGLATRYFATSGSLLDPLLYLRVPKFGVDGVETSTTASTPALELPSLDEILAAGREQSRLLVTPVERVARNKAVHQRQLKSREPLPQSGPKIPVAVFRFCQEHDVKYISIQLNRTYRSIAFSHGRGKPMPSDFDPWEMYIERNHLSHYRLCHSLLFNCLDRGTGESTRLVVIVPHSPKKSSQVDLNRIVSLLGEVEVKRLSLSQVEKELGFPTFVCPPFGHEFAPKLHALSERPKFKTIIDASLVVPARTDCVFDVGIVGLRLRSSELKRLAEQFGWTVIQDLVN